MKKLSWRLFFVLAVLVSTGLMATVSMLNAQKDEATQLQKQLKLFRSEFVDITPGEGKFPKTITLSVGADSDNDKSANTRSFELKQSFSVSKYEVYQNLYEAVMDSNPSRWKGPRNSAERMTVGEAMTFCKKVTDLMRAEKLISEEQIVRLPTEIEWEYFARAGTSTRYSFGEEAQATDDVAPKATILDAYAWHTGNAAGNDPAVGVLKPNPWGLYDIHGYLCEYCADDWDKSRLTAPIDAHVPINNESGSVSIRSGSWKDPFPYLASAHRRPFPKQGRDDAVGFRCVLANDGAEK